MISTSGRTERSGLTAEALFGVCLTYLVSALALPTTQVASFLFTDEPEWFGRFTTAPVIAALALIPIIAALIRQQPTWEALLAGLIMMLFGAVALFYEGGQTSTAISLGFSSVGQQIIAATLLIAAWRSAAKTRVLLAGVFALPEVLVNPLTNELLNSASIDSRAQFLGVTIGLLVVGLISASVVRSGSFEAVTDGERSSVGSDTIGFSLVLVALSYYAVTPTPNEAGIWTGLALLCGVAGALTVGIGRIGEGDQRPAAHADLPLVAFYAATTVCVTWLTLSSGTSFDRFNIYFDEQLIWSRGTSVILAVTTVPLVMFAVGSGRRVIAASAAAGAVAGLVNILLYGSGPGLGTDLVLAMTSVYSLLLGWSGLILLGGAVVWLLRRTDDASIEGGVVMLLGFLPLVGTLAAKFAIEVIGDDLTFGPQTDETRLLAVVSTVGLAALTIWWTLRGSDELATEPETQIF